MNQDQQKITRFTAKYRLEKAINSLLGVVEGIAIDRQVNAGEIEFLSLWLDEHAAFAAIHPFSEIVPRVRAALSDGQLTEEEHADIVWLCRKLVSAECFTGAAPDLQRLHAVLAGIAADRQISTDELRGLSGWLEEHSHLSKTWPFEEACSLVTGVLSHQKISAAEHSLVIEFCSEFIALADSRTIVNPPARVGDKVSGICAACPTIDFLGKRFCFTGSSAKYSRNYLEKLVAELGGVCCSSVVRDLDYLVVGADGSPCWAYSCYGRKIEAAVNLRRNGSLLLIVHEHDFHDAVADYK